MHLSLSSAGRLDLATPGLILGGVALIVASLVLAATQLGPPAAIEPSGFEANQVEPTVSAAEPTPAPSVAEPSSALSGDRVATVLFVDATTGAGAATRAGDRVDVLGYFSRQVVGSEAVTRMLLPDVPVLTAEHSGASVALTLAVPRDSAMLLQEALAIGARPFVTLRSERVLPQAQGVPASFSDTDLAGRLAGLR